MTDPDHMIQNNGVRRKKHYGGILVLAAVFAVFLAIVAFIIIVLVTGSVKEPGDPAVPSGQSASQETSGSGEKALFNEALIRKIAKIKGILDENFLFTEVEPDFDTAFLNAYVDAYGDPYTMYYTPEEYAALMEEDSGTYSGIGVVIEQNRQDGSITIVTVYRNSPAEKAGLLPGDIITRVGEQSADGVDINILVTWVRGEPGTSVEITVYRPSIRDYVSVTAYRESIEYETVTYALDEDHPKIGYVAVDSFIETTNAQFRQAIGDMRDQGIQGLVIDLRNNGGGLLDACCSMVDFLLERGTVTYLLDKNGTRYDYNATDAASLNIPIVVLCNGNSASASEVFIGALRDHGLITTVGTKTFGKGIVQSIMDLGDGSGIKFTMAYYYTPNGECIHGTGITPDYVVEPETGENASDNQYEKAIELLLEKLK